jgi:hypothetical protein
LKLIHIQKRVNSLNKIILNEFEYAVLYNKQWNINNQSQWIRENFNPLLMGFSRALNRNFGYDKKSTIDYASVLKKSELKMKEFERMKKLISSTNKKKLKIKRKPFFNTRYFLEKKAWKKFINEEKEKEKLIEEIEDQESISSENSNDRKNSTNSDSSDENENAFKGISEFVKFKPSSPVETPNKFETTASLLQKRDFTSFENVEDVDIPSNLFTKSINMDVLLFKSNQEKKKIQDDLKRVSKMARDTRNLKSYFEKNYLSINSLLEDIREEGNNIGKAQKQAIESEINMKMQSLLSKINKSKASKELGKEINLCKLKAESEFYLLDMNKKSEQEKLVFLYFLNECAKKIPQAKSFILKNLKDSDLTSLVSSLIQAKEVNKNPELLKYVFSIRNQLWRWNYMNKLFKKSTKNKRSIQYDIPIHQVN